MYEARAVNIHGIHVGVIRVQNVQMCGSVIYKKLINEHYTILHINRNVQNET